MTLLADRRKAFFALFLALGGFVSQTQLTHQVLTVMEYNRPFFVFFITQSAFSLSVLCHLIYLAVWTRASVRGMCRGLKIAIVHQLRPVPPSQHLVPSGLPFPFPRFVLISLILTTGFTIPTILWFVGISLSSPSDVTVLWNTNAFFVYLISVTLLGHQHEHRKFTAVLLATLGAILIVYGGGIDGSFTKFPSRSIGDILALFASITYAGYQLFYDAFTAPRSHVSGASVSESTPLMENHKDAIYPPPYGLESSFWTSMIGVCTLMLLWVAFPLLAHFGLEEFSPPNDLATIFAILGAAMSGAAFLTGTMMLLASWGAVTTSVTALLTTVLVFLTDLMLGAVISIWSVLGSIAIVGAFAMLALADNNSLDLSTQESSTL